jgi:hypothetical protein
MTWKGSVNELDGNDRSGTTPARGGGEHPTKAEAAHHRRA